MKTTRTYYLLTGGYNLAQYFIWAIYPLFLTSRGLDVFQINAVLATYGITVVLFEVPTGAIADVFGRRLAFVLGCAVRSAAYALYTLAHDFRTCVMAEFVDAIGTTLVSGALDAWMVDTTRAAGETRPLDAVFARAAVVGRALMIAGGVAAGYLADVSLVLPWFVAATAFAATGSAGALLMRGDRAAAARPASVRHTALAGLGIVRRSPVLLVLCAVSLATAFGSVPIHMIWPGRLRDLGAEQFHLIGWVVAFLNVASLAGSAAVPRLLRRARRETVLAAAACWRAAVLAGLARATGLGPAIAGVLLQEVAFGLTDPVHVAWANEHVAAGERATVLSVRSTFVMLGASAGLLSIGLVARAGGVPMAFACSAAVFALTVPGIVLLGRTARRTAAAVTVPEPARAVNVA